MTNAALNELTMKAPDYEQWNGRALWTLFDACCLIHGYEPPPYGKVKIRLAAIAESERGAIEELYNDAKDALDFGDIEAYSKQRR